MMELPVIALAGNPNVGKSTLFNLLTGGRQHTSNWTGTTVACAHDIARLDGQRVMLVDLPGVYSLNPYSDEESASRDFLLHERVDLLVNVVDAANLERNLYLTTQLLETGLPLVVLLNKTDVAAQRGLRLDTAALHAALGVPVMSSTATGSADLPALTRWLAIQVAAHPAPEVCA